MNIIIDGDYPLILGAAVHPSVPLCRMAGPRQTYITWANIEDVGPYPWRQEAAGRTHSDTLQVRPHPLWRKRKTTCYVNFVHAFSLSLSVSLCLSLFPSPHYSAGCGRTGTIIGIDLARTMLQNKVLHMYMCTTQESKSLCRPFT